MEAASSPAVAKVAVDNMDNMPAAVKVAADNPVDSVAAVEAVATADPGLSYLKKRGERLSAHLFCLFPLSLFVAKRIVATWPSPSRFHHQAVRGQCWSRHGAR